MSGHTVQVDTFGCHGAFSLTTPYPISSKTLKEDIAKRLGLKPSSIPPFGLFTGPLGSPQRVLVDGDAVPAGAANLCFQRWNFDIEKEMKLVRHDDTAIHLLYSEAKFYVDCGRIQPTQGQKEELESLSDPFFPTERQYLELVQTIPGYSAFTAEGCTLLGDLMSNEVEIPHGTAITCTADTHGLFVSTDRTTTEWPWHVVRRWKTPTSKIVTFDVCLKKGNAPVMEWMALETPQAYFLSCTATAICNHLKEKRGGTLPEAKPHMAGRPFDPLSEFVNTELFGSVKFSSIQ